jgi:translation elongation factor EF-4
MQAEGRARVQRLRDVLDRQMFDVAIQAALDGKVRRA